VELVDTPHLVKETMYEDCKTSVYYNRDGRYRIYIRFPNGTHKVMSYPKYLMEIELGRPLQHDETIDHIDCNPLNNTLSNLRVLLRSEHCRIDAPHLIPQTFRCPVCGKIFVRSGKQLSNLIRDRRRKQKAGPFCSRHCSGIHSHNKQIYSVVYQELPSTKISKKLSDYDGNHNRILPNSVEPVNGNAELADPEGRASVETLQETPRPGEDKVQTTI